MTLPTDAKEREQWPLYDYMFGYFPDAWLEEVRVAWVGNQQHNPGEKMHWSREKSIDHMNKAMRHIWEHARGQPKDVDGTYHLAKARWRLGAALQLLVEQDKRKESHEHRASVEKSDSGSGSGDVGVNPHRDAGNGGPDRYAADCASGAPSEHGFSRCLHGIAYGSIYRCHICDPLNVSPGTLVLPGFFVSPRSG